LSRVTLHGFGFSLVTRHGFSILNSESSKHHYDAIILGGSLASRIAATLLAKEGCRVLTFREPSDPCPRWFHSSLHLDRLLKSLGSRTCVASPMPFQVLTTETRLSFHGPATLEEELRREFPASCDKVHSLLQKLQTLGEHLEKILWKSGGLPLLGFSNRLRFTLKRLQGKLNRSTLIQPLRKLMVGLEEDPAWQAIAALFAGLSLTPFDKLSAAEGALLWNNACRTNGVSLSGLEELLHHRYQQFHGEWEELSNLGALEYEFKRLTGISSKKGGKCTAGYFLVGSPATRIFLPKSLNSAISSPPPVLQYVTSPLDGMISPLLAPDVILGGNPPLRLKFTAAENGTFCAIDYAAANVATSEEDIRRRLGPVLPFAKFQLKGPFTTEPLQDQKPGFTSSRKMFLGASNPLKLKGNALLCYGAGILPSLGTTGEILVGMTVAKYVLRMIKNK
jgi:hypothetical protein